jgi:tripartite-type tricarboxylate transporter receptor subunit TctC
MSPVRSLAVAALVALAPPVALAQSSAYPSKPIRLIVTFPPGGPADIIGRALGAKMGPLLGQSIVIENRGGAGGLIGLDATAKSPPDGYTIVLGSAGGLAIAPSLTPMPFDVFRDLAPITHVVTVPEVLVAIPRLNVRTLGELLAYARANPGKLSFASSGSASMPHLAGELLKREGRIEMVHVPYKGAAPAVNDLLGGQVHLMFADIPVLLPHIGSGRLVAIAMGDAKRAPVLPDVPTTGEGGLPSVLATNWYGLLGPGATPREIVARLNQAATSALQSSDLAEQLGRQGAQTIGGAPEAFGAFLRAEVAKWGPLAKTTGAKWE